MKAYRIRRSRWPAYRLRRLFKRMGRERRVNLRYRLTDHLPLHLQLEEQRDIKRRLKKRK